MSEPRLSAKTELRVVRVVTTLGFYFFAVWCALDLTWGHAAGALAFGLVTIFLWAPEVKAQADLSKAQKDQERHAQAMHLQQARLGLGTPNPLTPHAPQPYGQQGPPQTSSPSSALPPAGPLPAPGPIAGSVPWR